MHAHFHRRLALLLFAALCSPAVAFGADTQPPSFAGLGTLIGGADEIVIGWSAAADDATAPGEIRYRVYTAPSEGDQNYSKPALETPAGALGCRLKCARGAPQYIIVRAVDAAGNEDPNKVEGFASANPTIYVDAAAGAARADGLTPQTAFGDIDSAIGSVIGSQGVNVHVAAGTYHGRLFLFDGVMLYGGFDRTFDPARRDFEKNASVLLSDTSNDLTVVAPGALPCGLDGFTLRGEGKSERGIVGDDCTLFLSHLRILDFKRSALQLRGNKSEDSQVNGILRALDIDKCGGAGIVLEGCVHVELWDCHIRNSHKEGIGGRGLYATLDNKANLQIERCTVEGAQDLGINLDLVEPPKEYGAGGKMRLVIRECIVKDNKDHGVSVDLAEGERAAGDIRVQVEDCLLTANGKSGLHLDTDATGDYRIARNRIAGNRGSSGVRLSGDSPRGLIRFANNIVAGNAGAGLEHVGAGTLLARYCDFIDNGGAGLVTTAGACDVAGCVLLGNAADDSATKASHLLVDRAISTTLPLDKESIHRASGTIDRAALAAGGAPSGALAEQLRDRGDPLERDTDGSTADLGAGGGPFAMNNGAGRVLPNWVEAVDLLPPPGSPLGHPEWSVTFSGDLTAAPAFELWVDGARVADALRTKLDLRRVTVLFEKPIPKTGRVQLALLPGALGQGVAQPWHWVFEYSAGSP